jgi:hypothetical protein
MAKPLKVFFSGKINPLSKAAAPYWRQAMVWKLNGLLGGQNVADVCLVEHRNKFLIEQNIPVEALFGQTCFYIQHADVLVVNLTDDISIGGSQEMLIAKQFGKPVIGIAPRGGKFNKLKYELGGKTYWNWLHPFVGALCDVVVHNVEELAVVLDDFESVPCSGLQAVDDAITYYLRSASAFDTSINDILSFRYERNRDSKQRVRIYFAGKMGKADGFDSKHWRNELSALISRQSRFHSVNLDFLEASHDIINENDPRLIFGRDAFLIRSSDLVVVNLSDDISVGGSIEMLIAKLYNRPLIGVARPNGKFVSLEKDMLGRPVRGYISPFVNATCDWLVHDAYQLPQVIDQLYNKPAIKDIRLTTESAQWYKQVLLPKDKVAQLTFQMA